MASSIIHICIAKKIREQIPLNEQEFLYGNILPDYSRKDRNTTHILKEECFNNIVKLVPNISYFLQQYQQDIQSDIEKGIYCHLITDYLWMKQLATHHIVKVEKGTYKIRTKQNRLVEDSTSDIYRRVSHHEYNTNTIVWNKHIFYQTQ